jgi:hypothetical protein
MIAAIGRNLGPTGVERHCTEGRYAGETDTRIAVVTEGKDPKIPPAVFSRDPEEDLEQKLRRNPDDQNAKVDVGSDESMDASDPPSTSVPGSNAGPAPSSGFPDKG